MDKRAKSGAALLIVAALSGCGDNFWSGLPTGSSGSSAAAPDVAIEEPVAPRRVAVNDSVLVRVAVDDTDAIASIRLYGVAITGSPELGTVQTVTRFQEKQVTFDSAVSDTVVSRFLLATGEPVPADSVYIIAEAKDIDGNAAADTVLVSIGGPRVAIDEPAAGASVRAGTALSVTISASDNAGRIQSLRVQASGGFEQDTTIAIDPALAELEREVVLRVPDGAIGETTLRASVATLANDSAVSMPVVIDVAPPVQDTQGPVVTFGFAAPSVAEHDDSVTVTVSAVDSTRVDSVGVIVNAMALGAQGTQVELVRTDAADESRFRFAIDELGFPEPTDTGTVRLEIMAFAVDSAGNCSAATIEATPRSEVCPGRGDDAHTAIGARWEILMVRGRTVPLSSPSDQIADLASQGSYVFLSNLTKNRVDVIPVGSMEITDTISVGSQPWGLAFDPTGDTLYVANSGGTNISKVSVAERREVARIQTPNMKLFSVDYDPVTHDVARVTKYDYSDRPQFIAVTQNQNVIYSTRPTPAASDGTVRVYRPGQGTRPGRLEIITDYVEHRPEGKLVVLNADSAFLLPGGLIEVCPRARSADPEIDGTLSEDCFEGSMAQVESTIRSLGYDTEFHFNKDVGEVGLTDTTFVAVSGDHSTVAFGEGGIDNARIMILVDSAGSAPDEPLHKHGETADLIGNAAERVIGLALNQDGSLGVARGDEAYYFSRDLRLQGVVETGAQSGGVDMHPASPDLQRSFVSGIDPGGLSYIDVLDSYHFRYVSRIFLRDPVTGPIRAVETAGGLMIYAVTDRGVVVVEVLAEDL